MSSQDPPPQDRPGQQPSYGPQQPSYGSQQPSYGSTSDPYGGTPPQGPYGSYSQPYAGDQSGYGGYQQEPRNGLGITALVLGIVALLLCWIPFLGLLFGLIGLVAIILGIVGLRRVKQGRANNRGVALTGIILGALALVISIAISVLVGRALGPTVVECSQLPTAAEQQQCVEDRLGVQTAP